MKTTDKVLPLLMTMGDPNGVGPEICLKALAKPLKNVTRPVAIVGDFDVLRAAALLLGIKKSLVLVENPEDIRFAVKFGIPVWDAGIKMEEKVFPGPVTSTAGPATTRWGCAAVGDVDVNRAAAIV